MSRPNVWTRSEGRKFGPDFDLGSQESGSAKSRSQNCGFRFGRCLGLERFPLVIIAALQGRAPGGGGAGGLPVLRPGAQLLGAMSSSLQRVPRHPRPLHGSLHRLRHALHRVPGRQVRFHLLFV